jgi:diguanylate cyclase (GGDEF)-like protein/PAS domain S-box-containing protein
VSPPSRAKHAEFITRSSEPDVPQAGAWSVESEGLATLDLETVLQRLTLAIDSSGIGIWEWDIKNDLMLWDDWMYRLYGLEPENGVSSYEIWRSHLHPHDRAATEQAISDALSGAKLYNTEFQVVWNDGSIHHLRASGQVMRDPDGQPSRMIGTNWDITPLKQAEKARDDLRAQFAAILDNMKGYFFQRAMSPDGHIYHPFVSDSLYKMLGVPLDPAGERPDILKFVSPADQERVARSIRQSARDFTRLEMELRMQTLDGRELWVSSNAQIRRLDDGTFIWDGFGTDISAEKRAAEELFYLTYHDKQTGLGNRLVLENALEKAVQEAAQNKLPFAMVFIAIGEFRAISSTLGVARGDLIIRKTAERLKRLAGDGAIVARTADDEFAVLKTGMTEDEISHLPLEIGAALAEPMLLAVLNAPAGEPTDSEVSECRIAVNIGIASSRDEDPDGQTAVSEYIKRGNIALYEARRLGLGQICRYTHDIDDRIRNRLLLRQSLHAAIDNQEFVIHYQPILDLRSGAIIAAEALLRWDHPTLGRQPPAEFIPLAEESGLIVPLGAWVLKTSMTQIREWRAAFGIRKIAVNVSGVQFEQADFVETIEALLRETGATADMIELELTESMLVDCSRDMLERMNALRRLGLTLAIDDFGTGYSSLKYLSKLPVDKLKIDQSFVRQMSDDSSDATIVRTIVALGKGLNLEVFAEGVETAAQRQFLVDQGCRSGQGYLFSRPVPAADFAALLRNRGTLPLSNSSYDLMT